MHPRYVKDHEVTLPYQNRTPCPPPTWPRLVTPGSPAKARKAAARTCGVAGSSESSEISGPVEDVFPFLGLAGCRPAWRGEYPR